jgi:Reverse transcriptase (RNA-dependent DNA polymerase)
MRRTESGESSRRQFLQVAMAAGLAASQPDKPAQAARLLPPDVGGSDAAIDPNGRSATLRSATLARQPDRGEIASAVQRALSHNVSEGLDPVFPTPFELARLRDDADLQRAAIELLVDCLMRSDIRAHRSGPVGVMSVPKSNLFGYRYFAQFDVLDSTLYLALAVLIANRFGDFDEVDAERRIFSNRLLREGSAVFDDRAHFGAFMDRVLEKIDARSKAVLVSADIANFYPSIDDARLNHSLAGRGVEQWLLDALKDTLSRWKWLWPQGLPVGPAASHILADLALSNVDKGLAADGVDFVRYFDDYRLFAGDMQSASYAIGRLTMHLQAEGLALNQSKTLVEAVTREEYAARLTERRILRQWNQLPPGPLAQAKTAPAAIPAPAKAQPAKGGSDQKAKSKKDCGPYNACSPFKKSKKSQLDDLDRMLLGQVRPRDLLSTIRQQAASGSRIALGDFRTLIEHACMSGHHRLIADALPLLQDDPLPAIYLIDVLIEEREHIPAEVREIAADWFAARLVSRKDLSEFEVMNIAGLLGFGAYARPHAVFAYLDDEGRSRSPTMLRALLTAIEPHVDHDRAGSLLRHFAASDPFVRRKLFDLVWPHLDRDQRSELVYAYRTEFERDPFLRPLAAAPEPARGVLTPPKLVLLRHEFSTPA